MLLTALKSLLPRVKGIAPTNRIAVVVLLSICCFFPQDISAQSLSTLEIELKKERKSNFMFTGTLSAESNLQQGTDESTHVSRINMIPRYKLNSKNILGADMTYVKNHAPSTEGSFDNVRLYYRNKKNIHYDNEKLKFLQALSIYLPTNEVEREEEKYLGSLQYEPRLVFNIYPGSKKIPMTYRLKLRKHFHRTQANENGENQSYSFKNEIAGESNIFQSNFSAGLILNFGNSWTYSGQPKMKYSTSQFLGYSVNDQSILQIGHLYGDTLYRANEGVFRLKKYNKFDSLFFTNLIMIF